MRRILVLLLLLSVCAPALAGNGRDHGKNVVGLVVTHQDWDEDRPWARTSPKNKQGSGVVVDGPYVLTTAQMVANATYIRMEKFGRTTQFVAEPYFVDQELDLALVAVNDPAFFDDLEPVRLAEDVPLDADARTVRWNDQQLESVASRVKRAEVQDSFFGEAQHVFLQVATDITGGGWAEPVFVDGTLAGLTVSQNESRARVIPTEIIAGFLDGARDPEGYAGLPVLGVQWQVNQDPALARFLGQSGPPAGVVVRQIPWGSSGCGVLEPRDILLSLDGRPIGAEGYSAHPRYGQLRFTSILAEHRAGDTVPVTVLRDGEILELEMPLRRYVTQAQLIPPRRGNEAPPYLIAGGLVFREFDGDFLRSWGKEWARSAPVHLLTRYFLGRETQTPDSRRVVLISSVLPSSYNVGYQSVRYQPVETINGRAIDSIGDVVEALDSPGDGYHVIVLEPNSDRREIVLDAATLDAATTEILETYGIPQTRRLTELPAPDAGPACPGHF